MTALRADGVWEPTPNRGLRLAPTEKAKLLEVGARFAQGDMSDEAIATYNRLYFDAIANEATPIGSKSVLELSEDMSWEMFLGPTDPGDPLIQREVPLKGVLPIPDETVPFERLFELRDRHRTELLRMRQAVAGLMDNIRHANDPAEALNMAKREIELSTREMYDAAKSLRVRMISSIVALLTAPTVLQSVVPGRLVEMAFDGFGVEAAGIATAVVIGRSANRRALPYAYLSKVKRELGLPRT